MAAPDTDKELEQPRDATRKVKRGPLYCGISIWGVIALGELASGGVSKEQHKASLWGYACV